MKQLALNRVMGTITAIAAVFWVMSGAAGAVEAASVADAAKVTFQWSVKIPMRDGVHLNATVYTPKEQGAPAPCVFTLTPYIAQSYHDRGMYFAAHGYPLPDCGRGKLRRHFPASDSLFPSISRKIPTS